LQVIFYTLIYFEREYIAVNRVLIDFY